MKSFLLKETCSKKFRKSKNLKNLRKDCVISQLLKCQSQRSSCILHFIMKNMVHNKRYGSMDLWICCWSCCQSCCWSSCWCCCFCCYCMYLLRNYRGALRGPLYRYMIKCIQQQQQQQNQQHQQQLLAPLAAAPAADPCIHIFYYEAYLLFCPRRQKIWIFLDIPPSQL